MQTFLIDAENTDDLQQALLIRSTQVLGNPEVISKLYAHFGLAPIDMTTVYTPEIRQANSNLIYDLHAIFYYNQVHYWAYILDHKTSQWWLYNDEHVQSVKNTDVLTDSTGVPILYSYVHTEDIDLSVPKAINPDDCTRCILQRTMCVVYLFLVALITILLQ